MAPSDTVALRPPRRLRVMETLASVAITLVAGAALLWNWDGFWQTEIPLLASLQETYFPVKHAQEQDKLVNTRTNTVRWAEALRRIEELEAANQDLRARLEARGERP